MVFNSTTFLFFFLLFFPCYWLLCRKASVNILNLFVIAASYFFYGWWDWRFLGLIIISSVADYTIGFQLGKTNHAGRRKTLLVLSIVINLGILGFFKYSNFFIDSLNGLLAIMSLQINLRTLSVILPVGISFYTFQTLSYTIDIYRGKIAPVRNPIPFFAFVAFFPQLVAGPIERAGNLLPQFIRHRHFDYGRCISGLRLVLWGLFKKIGIADNFGLLADRLFDVDMNISGPTVLIAGVFFSFQIYADFSGYSDIAIGISRMLGIDLMQNFTTPYFSGSMREFWQRWHISLSSWFRDYVYFPLGGSRVSRIRTDLNLFITFLLSGLWHGAQITFAVWGALHGLVLIIGRKIKIHIPRILAVPSIFFLVTLFWIPFRAENMDHLSRLASSLVQFSAYTFSDILAVVREFSVLKLIYLSAILSLFLIVEQSMGTNDFSEWISGKKSWSRLAVYYLILLTMLFMGNFDVKPDFIYFQF